MDYSNIDLMNENKKKLSYELNDSNYLFEGPYNQFPVNVSEQIIENTVDDFRQTLYYYLITKILEKGGNFEFVKKHLYDIDYKELIITLFYKNNKSAIGHLYEIGNDKIKIIINDLMNENQEVYKKTHENSYYEENNNKRFKDDNDDEDMDDYFGRKLKKRVSKKRTSKITSKITSKRTSKKKNL